LTVGAAASDGKMNKATARQATLSSVDAKLAVQAGRDPAGTMDRPGPSRARRREPEISRTKKTLLKTFFTVTVAAAAAY